MIDEMNTKECPYCGKTDIMEHKEHATIIGFGSADMIVYTCCKCGTEWYKGGILNGKG